MLEIVISSKNIVFERMIGKNNNIPLKVHQFEELGMLFCASLSYGGIGLRYNEKDTIIFDEFYEENDKLYLLMKGNIIGYIDYSFETYSQNHTTHPEFVPVLSRDEVLDLIKNSLFDISPAYFSRQHISLSNDEDCLDGAIAYAKSKKLQRQQTKNKTKV